jgi:uncharacterized RDD family membrane protein YckC
MTRTNTLLIRTPEGVVFSQTLAGPVTRFLAWLIDFTCVLGLLFLLNLVGMFLLILSPAIANALSVLLYFVVPVGYAMTLEWIWRGQTFGKRILRIRVVDAQGLRLQFSQVAIRNLLRVIDLLPGMYLVGGVAALFTRKAQRLGDLAANTVVIRIPKIIEPNLEQLGADKYNSLRAYPHLCARLRQRVSPAEANAALQAIIRRDEFEAGARVQLFADFAEHFKSKVAFPAEAIEGIADEQFVRNVADVLYRTEVRAGRSLNQAVFA